MAKLLARLVHRLPKIGPLKKMDFKYPGVTCEELFLKSMDSIMVNYDLALATLADGRPMVLPNINYDTGNLSVLNEYTLADTTYAEWLVKLENDNGAKISPAMQHNISAFYNKAEVPIYWRVISPRNSNSSLPRRSYNSFISPLRDCGLFIKKTDLVVTKWQFFYSYL